MHKTFSFGLAGNAIHEPAEARTEQQVQEEIRQSLQAEGACKWEQGRLFQELHAEHGRTDQEIADEFGLAKATAVSRRMTYVDFGHLGDRFSSLSWKHFREARSWIIRVGDVEVTDKSIAESWLEYAASEKLSVAKKGSIAGVSHRHLSRTGCFQVKYTFRRVSDYAG
ncbi:hypothetical protein [Planctomycetes bacterium K23_9]|uniref:hypothetical protein n=1 Tax=Stieleria marina TaxID=1930275 RepID=UPI00119E467D